MNFIKAFFRKNFTEASIAKKVISLTIFAVFFVIAGVSIVQAISSMTVTDTFNDSTKIASATNVTVDTVNGQIYLSQAAAWSCGSSLFDTRDGKSYATVLIGSQCWMQQNLNVGTMVSYGGNQGVSTTSIQKYCYGNGETNCTTYGGFYQWDQAMGGSVTAGTRGICPSGWHFPTHYEWTQLELATCTSGSCATSFPYDYTTTGARGTNEGTTLKASAGLFKGIYFMGGRYNDGSWQWIGQYGRYWASNQSGANAWYRQLESNGVSTVYRSTDSKIQGLSIRCVKD